MAKCYRAKQDFEKAKELITKCLHLDPDHKGAKKEKETLEAKIKEADKKVCY